MKKSMIEILEETVNFYSEDPKKRSAGRYNSSDSNHCAVGRCLLSELKQKGEGLEGNTNDLLTLICENDLNSLDEALLPEYRGHSLLFWQDLQNLHDLDVCWTDDFISEKGKRQVEIMNQRILENYY
jgi:hypothetical protein